MAGYIVRRLLQAIPVLLGTTFLIYFMVFAMPGDPIVALFGATIPDRWRPWRDARWFTEAVDAGPLPCRPCRQRTCEPGDFRCLTRISAEEVAAAAERALAARDLSSRKAVHA